MANRCMIFATDSVPFVSTPPGRILPLGEHAWEIPTLYKLLVSADPAPSRSAVFAAPEPMAIAGLRTPALARLQALRARAGDDAAAAASLDAAIAVIAPLEHTYILLEPGEILAMEEEATEAQLEALLADIRALDDAALAELAEATDDADHWAGASWSSTLYYSGPQFDRPPITPDLTRLSTTPAHILAHRDALSACADLASVYVEIDGGSGELGPALSALANIPGPFELWLSGRCEQLPPEIGALARLTSLNLGGLGLTSLPPELGGLIQLDTLYLWGNALDELPDALAGLTSLTQLAVHRNPLRALPDWFGALQRLERLEADECALTALPDSFWTLRALKYANVAANPLGVLPDRFAGLSALEEFCAAGCGLRALPPSLFQLPSLLRLRVGMNPLGEAPAELGDLAALEELALGQCGLTRLPDSLCRLKRLKLLDLVENRLATLPRCIYGMPLEILFLSGNPLRKPGFFGPKFAAQDVRW